MRIILSVKDEHVEYMKKYMRRKRRLNGAKEQKRNLGQTRLSSGEPDPNYHRKWQWQTRWGVDPVVAEILWKSKSVCDICGDPVYEFKNKHLDHNHVTKMLRGILCSRCNQGLGYFRDDVVFLNRAIEYLRLAL